MLKVRFAITNDINNIMKFVHEHWKSNHILSKNKELFLYEYKNSARINFVIAVDSKNSIYGILGFIKSSNKTSDIWGTMWKAINHHDHLMLGVELLQYLRESNQYNTLTNVGINTNTLGIYNYLGIYTDHLSQFVIINHHCKIFNILKLKSNKYLTQTQFIEDKNYNLIEIEENELNFNFDNQKYIPHKDKNYFIKRYFNHPIYSYSVFGIYKNSMLASLIVTREVIVNDSKILRIMDYIGDENDLVYVSKYLYQIVLDNGYEYIDFMCYGFNEEILVKAGFRKINLESTEIIVPNYFAPFVQENVKIYFMADTKEIDKIRICKADGDQDRPN